MTEEASNQISPQGFAALEAEIDELETEGRRAIAARIKTAREWGDLSENAEYHDAKEAQAHLETKILRLRAMRDNAVVVERRQRRRGRARRVRHRARRRQRPRGDAHDRGRVGVRPGRRQAEHRLAARPRAHGRACGRQVAFEAPRGRRSLEVLKIA